MSLFGLGKKKEEKCSCGCSCQGKVENADFSNEKPVSIKVLGAGCASCHKMYENAKEAVNNLGTDIQVEYVTDMEKIMEYGVMSMPAFVVNEKVVSMGKVLKTAEIEDVLK